MYVGVKKRKINAKIRQREIKAFEHLDEKNSSKHKIITYDVDSIENDIIIEKLEKFVFQKCD